MTQSTLTQRDDLKKGLVTKQQKLQHSYIARKPKNFMPIND
jgi:hypothetical protein